MIEIEVLVFDQSRDKPSCTMTPGQTFAIFLPIVPRIGERVVLPVMDGTRKQYFVTAVEYRPVRTVSEPGPMVFMTIADE